MSYEFSISVNDNDVNASLWRFLTTQQSTGAPPQWRNDQ